MNPIILTCPAADGELQQVTFLPDKGMNMISFKKGSIEVIDQSTHTLFDERFAGLGALIGPHFHRRNTAILPQIADESLFPHIARIKAKGVADPFSHGIARYAPWKNVTYTPTSLKGVLSGKDEWNGVSLTALEGQNFTMRFDAELMPDGLHLSLSIVSETDSLVGIHYYYHLPKGTGMVIASVQPDYIVSNERKAIPSTWNMSQDGKMVFKLDQDADFTFFPSQNKLQGSILLDAVDYVLETRYRSPSQENCWQLYHPKGASFVCIEPISAQDPRHPNLTVSGIDITLTVKKVGEGNLAG